MPTRPLRIGDRVDTGTWFMNRCDYLDPALAWVGVKDSGRGCTLASGVRAPHAAEVISSAHAHVGSPMNLKGNWNYPTLIRFGAGRIRELPDACRTLGMQRPLIVTDPGLAKLPMIGNAVSVLWRKAASRRAVFSDIQANPVEANVDARCRGISRRIARRSRSRSVAAARSTSASRSRS